MKKVITVSRKWNNPHIETRITLGEDGGIQLSMALSDFEEALFQEINSVALTFTRVGFKKQLAGALERVVHGIKEESIKIV